MSLDDMQDKIEILEMMLKASNHNFDLLYRAVVNTCEMDTVLAIHYAHLDLIKNMDPSQFFRQ